MEQQKIVVSFGKERKKKPGTVIFSVTLVLTLTHVQPWILSERLLNSNIIFLTRRRILRPLGEGSTVKN